MPTESLKKVSIPHAIIRSMTVRTFLGGSLAGAIIGWGVWLLILNLIDPTEAGLIGYILFFLTLFLAITSTIGLLGYAIRRVLAPGQLSTYRVRSRMSSLRPAVAELALVVAAPAIRAAGGVEPAAV